MSGDDEHWDELRFPGGSVQAAKVEEARREYRVLKARYGDLDILGAMREIDRLHTKLANVESELRSRGPDVMKMIRDYDL